MVDGSQKVIIIMKLLPNLTLKEKKLQQDYLVRPFACYLFDEHMKLKETFDHGFKSIQSSIQIQNQTSKHSAPYQHLQRYLKHKLVPIRTRPKTPQVRRNQFKKYQAYQGIESNNHKQTMYFNYINHQKHYLIQHQPKKLKSLLLNTLDFFFFSIHH